MELDPGQLIQTGGIGTLAILVYLEQRQIRLLLRSVELALSALLERERVQDSGPVKRPIPTLRQLPTSNPEDK